MIVANDNLATISVHYHLANQLRINTTQGLALRSSHNVQGEFIYKQVHRPVFNVLAADLFEAYVGGLFVEAGLEPVKQWLFGVLAPYAEEAYRIVRNDYNIGTSPLPKRKPQRFIDSTTLKAGDLGHLAFLNQSMTQQCKKIEWKFSTSEEGSKTTPVHIVELRINGTRYSTARGNTKKVAKNEAAREALEKLGLL